MFNSPCSIERSTSAGASLRLAALLLGTTILAGLPEAAFAQAPAPVAPVAVAPAPAPAVETTIQSITVNGAQRLEPDTIRSYIKLRIGQPYSQVSADGALKDL
ncbi:MAG: outer membrane protein assembly factor BamA, partial [Novosphingobium sp.]